MMSLWDLLSPEKLRAWLMGKPEAPAAPISKKKPARNRSSRAEPIKPVVRKVKPGAAAKEKEAAGASERYEAMTKRMLAEHGVRVKRWRTAMSGVAWQVRYRDGSVVNLIEAPKPKGPMSAAVFLHEIGHHAIGLNRYSPRCLEEYHAWAWAISAMEAHGIAITDGVKYRMHQSLAYAVAKARRRGLKALPPELLPYAEYLPWKKRRAAG